MYTRDIAEQAGELYGISVSAGNVSNAANAAVPEVHEWNGRPLESLKTAGFPPRTPTMTGREAGVSNPAFRA
ncbi:MAG: transposase [Clostridiales bacterium]|nr:transposase [Clostridiales bacterium]